MPMYTSTGELYVQAVDAWLANPIIGSGRDGTLVFDGVNPVIIQGTSIAPALVNGRLRYALTDACQSVQAKRMVCSDTVEISLNFNYPVKAWEIEGPETGMFYISDNGDSSSNQSAVTGLLGRGVTQRTSGAGGAGKTAVAAGSAGSNSATTGYGGDGGAGGSGGAGGAGGGDGVVTLTSPDASGQWKDIVDLALLTGHNYNGGIIKGGAGGGGGGFATAGVGTYSSAGGAGGGVVLCAFGKITNGANITLEAMGGNSANASGTNGQGTGGGGGGGAIGLRYGQADAEPTLDASGGTCGTPTSGGAAGTAGSVGQTSVLSYLT